MNSKLITKLLVIGSVWALTGCQSESQDLGQGKIDYAPQPFTSDGVKLDVNAMVDILFVIDDSGSMRAHQTQLAKNIDKFVDEFAKSSIIDFHIGVTTVWDSRRYGLYDVDSNTVVSQGIVPFKDRNGVQLYDQVGHLRPVKAPQGMEEALKSQPANYIVQGPNFVELLRESLKVGVRKWVESPGANQDASGPMWEEVFSPIAAAVRQPVAETANRGFLRQGAYLVVVIVTDATDASSISFSQLNRILKDVKGEGNYSVFGVVNPRPTKECPQDFAGNPAAITDLIHISGGTVLNMCTDYAGELVQIGKQVRDRTLSELRIPIPPGRLLNVDSIEVTYGGEEIPYGQFNGWVYDGDSKSIIIRGAARWVSKPGAKVEVSFEPVNPTRRSSHCVGCPTK